MILKKAITYLREYCDGYLENERVYKLLSQKDSLIIQNLSNALYEMSEFTPPDTLKGTIWDKSRKENQDE